MIRPVRLLVLFLVLTAPGAIAAQPTGAFVRAWADAQQRAADDVAVVRMEETTERTLDTGFGARRLHVEAALAGLPGGAWRRTVRAATVNGRPIPPERVERLEDGFHRRMGDDRLLDALLLPAPLLRRLQPLRPRGEADAVFGRPAVRFDFAARGDAPVERVSLWFEPDERRLLHARVVLARPRPADRAAHLVVTTDYARIDELDLPVRRRLDGSVRMRRRSRAFTVVVDAESRYANHAVDR